MLASELIAYLQQFDPNTEVVTINVAYDTLPWGVEEIEYVTPIGAR